MKRLEQLRRLLKDYDDNEIEQLYTKEHPERQKLIQPSATNMGTAFKRMGKRSV